MASEEVADPWWPLKFDERDPRFFDHCFVTLGGEEYVVYKRNIMDGEPINGVDEPNKPWTGREYSIAAPGKPFGTWDRYARDELELRCLLLAIHRGEIW